MISDEQLTQLLNIVFQDSGSRRASALNTQPVHLNKVKTVSMSSWNWKQALVRAGISSGLVFLGALAAVGIDVLLTTPLRVFIPAVIGAGIAFLSVLQRSESDRIQSA